MQWTELRPGQDGICLRSHQVRAGPQEMWDRRELGSHVCNIATILCNT